MTKLHLKNPIWTWIFLTLCGLYVAFYLAVLTEADILEPFFDAVDEEIIFMLLMIQPLVGIVIGISHLIVNHRFKTLNLEKTFD